MKTILLNVNENKIEHLDVEDKLEEFYKLIKCRTIDIVKRKIGGRYFDVVCDDEGLFADEVKISAINDIGVPLLVGNLLFFNHDSEGNLLPLSDEDCGHIKKYIKTRCTNKYPEGYLMLTQCEY